MPVEKNKRDCPAKFKITGLFLRILSKTCIIALCVTCFQLNGCSTTGTKEEASLVSEPTESTLNETWGIQIQGIRYSAAGYMLDFRYKVIDPEKAAYLLDRRYKPYLIDQKTGARFVVPAPAKVGPLRQTIDTGTPMAGRTYFVMFANPGQYIKPGNKVTVVIGEFKAENLTVE